jgi:hypothetical protein
MKRVEEAASNIMKNKENKIELLLNMDCRLPENMAKLKKAVNSMKWFERFEFEEITPNTVEQGYLRVEKKYGIRIGYIQKASELSWSIMIKSDEGKWIDTVICHTLFEGMCKTMIVLYGYLVKGIKFKTEEK